MSLISIEIPWCKPNSVVTAAVEAIKLAIVHDINDDYMIKLLSSIITNDRAVIRYDFRLYKDGKVVSHDPLNLVFNIKFGITNYGIDIDEMVSNTEKLVIDVKIDDTFSPNGVKYLQDEVIAQIGNYANWVQDELNFEHVWVEPFTKADNLRDALR